MPYILVVDDDIDARGMTMLALQDAGFKVIGTHNGLEALLFITDPGRPTRPYLILLDLNMPTMDGRKFLQVVKCCDHLSDIPIVIVSGEPVLPDGYVTLPKPVSLDRLLQLAEEHWKRAGSPNTSRPDIPPRK